MDLSSCRGIRFLLYFFFAMTLLDYAKAEGQSITIDRNKITLDQALTELKTQSRYAFFWSDQLVKTAPLIDVHLKHIPLKDALDEILKGLPFSYKIEGKFVYVLPATAAPSGAAVQQPLIIHGKVTDSLYHPISGVSVFNRRLSKGVVTDSDGIYRIPAEPGDVLQFSHVGYVMKEAKVGTGETLNVRLDAQSSLLNEIVIVGYGTQQRKDVTGAIAAIGPKELKQSPVANISNALAGRLPGLVTVQNSGEPGADGAALYIRGFGTTGNNSPLILVDGIERDFSNLDPNEVSNITILKDAASTAIYGIRGANGVVLITTRRGVNAKPRISITAQNGWQSPTRLPEYADAYDALKLYREGLQNDGLSTTQYTDSILNLYRDRSHPAYQYLYPSVDWLKTMLKPFSYLSQGNLNVTGGNSAVKYFVSMSYLRQNGLYNFENQIKQYDIQAVTNKYNFRSNIDLQISKDLSMELNLGAIVRDRNYPGTDAQTLFTKMKQTPSWWYPLKNPDGSVPQTPNLDQSPYDLLVNSGYQRLFETTLQSTAGFKWDMHYFLKGLSSRVRLSFDNLNFRNVARPLSSTTYKYNLLPGILPDTAANLTADGTYVTVRQGNGTLDYQVNANGTRRTTLEYYLNYDRSFGRHSFHGVVVYTQSSFFDQVASGQANAIAGLPYKYDGVVGRISYNYDDRYLLEVNGGYNGSENFAPGHRLGFFPAVSAGWVLSKEKFIAGNSSLSFIDNLKIRGSYGVVGNDQIGGARFLYLTAWTITGGGYQFGTNRDGNSYSGAYETQIGNPDVTWEKSKNSDLGLDLSLWNGGLSLTADYFWDHRTNILLTSQLIPATLGLINIPPTNGGIVDNHGYEISIEHKKEFKKQGYSIRLNASYARNKIKYYAEPPYTGREWQAVTGTEVGEQYGYTSPGLFKSAQDVSKSPDQSYFGPTQAGDIKYKDLNKDGTINSLDQGYLPGKVNTPRSILGLSMSYHYSAFDVSVFFQAGLGGTVMTIGNGIFPFARFTGVLKEVINNHWVASAPDKNYEFPRMSSQDNPDNEATSTFWLKSSNYLRLKTFEVGYSFPSKWISRIGFSNARLFANGINLLTWDHLKIFDPEIANGGTGTYPQQKVINTGFTFTF